MLVRADGFVFRALMFLTFPSMYLPRLMPLKFEHARVGSDTTTWCKVGFDF